jgi:hypothetical protein
MDKKLWVCLFFFSFWSGAQNNRVSQSAENHFQYGVSVKGVLEFQLGIPNFRIGLNAGVGLPIIDFLYPTANLELDIYYGGLGSKFNQVQGNRVRKQFNADFISALTLTAGWDPVFDNLNPNALAGRNAPLYYFADFVQPSLQNPYGGSVSFGSDFILPLRRGKDFQRAAFVDIHFEKFQIAYCNDGGPFMGWFLGDGEDRYYTGSGFAAYNDPRYKDVNTYMLSFHKYTGWTENSFDDADLLIFGFTDYSDIEQSKFNAAFWSISVGNAGSGSVFFRFNNPKNFREIQNLIHYVHGNPFHQNLIPPYHSIGISGNLLSTFIPKP